jgi:hypothetical protein
MIAKYWWNNQDKLTQAKDEEGLGFRDLHSFNMAILAKQGWQLIQNPSSLCARILKAKYFSNCNLLNTKTKDGWSYTWRSIMQGVQVLKEGII